MSTTRTAAALLGLALATASPLAGQERIAVLTEPGTPVVATEVLLTVGPADEPAARAGLAHLSARAILAQLQPSLDSLGAHASLEAHKDALSFSVIASPEVWEAATSMLLQGLFRVTPDSAIVLRERRAIAAELRARLSNPADAATREMDRAFFGQAHPWGRPTVGTPESVERLTVAQVREFLRESFTPDRAYAVVVGPVEDYDARQHLRPLLGTTLPSRPEQIATSPSARRVRLEYNSVTTWVSASYAIPESADEEALRFLVFLATDALSFSPSQRSIYNAWSEVVPRVGGGEIRLQVVIPPEEATAWAERVQRTMAEIAASTLPEDVHDTNLRRYRGDRIMRLMAPEDRARDAARQLLVRGRVVAGGPDILDLSQQRIRNASRVLGTPTVLILGPTLD